MEKEELVEMINSTINTNGSGAITGEALNLALQAIVETMGTGSGSGAEKLQGYFDGSAWQQTEEEKALNAQLYAKIVTALENGEPISVWGKATADGATFNFTSASVGGADTMVIIVSVLDGAMIDIALSSDGSISASMVSLWQ